MDCVIYAARSEDEKPGKDSTGSQTEHCRERIAQLGKRTVIGEYVDHASGFKSDRGLGLAEAIEAAVAASPCELWVIHSSRLGRGTGKKGEARAIGKLLYDPTLYDQAKEAIGNTNAVIGDVRAGKGSLGKLATDDALFNKLRDTSTNLANATAKLNDNTTSAGKLFSDPQLYDNLTGLTGDLRLLIGDFRQNPKKFLHLKVTIF